ncbi:MAG TPA: hypothetical protein VGN81_40875, partial [Pseudonocardiaceae bacterium]
MFGSFVFANSASAACAPGSLHRVAGHQVRDRDAGDADRAEHLVVQDHAVAFACQRRDPALRAVVVDVDRAHQQVEPACSRARLDAAVEHVGEHQALVLVGDHAVRR